MTTSLSLALASQFADRRRVMLGIAGPPGAGKSTLAAKLAQSLDGVVVALDGFHLPHDELAARGLLARKGSPDTFDVDRFIDLLQRVRDGQPANAPIYSRALHEPVADAVRIDPATKFVIVEGNYLLLESEPWSRGRGLLDACWYLDVPVETCLQRVRARHVAGGRSDADAARRVAHNDRMNAGLVLSTRPRADRVIDGSEPV